MTAEGVRQLGGSETEQKGGRTYGHGDSVLIAVGWEVRGQKGIGKIK